MQTATQNPTPPYRYTVTSGSQKVEVEGRTKAIDKAKAMSRSFHGPVHLERRDERVSMTFRRGSLQQYQYETRR